MVADNVGESGDFGGWFCPCHGSHYDICTAPPYLHFLDCVTDVVQLDARGKDLLPSTWRFLNTTLLRRTFLSSVSLVYCMKNM